MNKINKYILLGLLSGNLIINLYLILFSLRDYLNKKAWGMKDYEKTIEREKKNENKRN